MKSHNRFIITENSQVGQLRREISMMAARVGFNETRKGEVAIIVSEIGTNLIKHTPQGGEVLVKTFPHKNNPGLEIISIDDGPGMSYASFMIQNGISTSGTLGTGLGAIKRLSHEFDLYSKKDQGTILLSRIWQYEKSQRTLKKFEIGAICVPKPDETECGDLYCYEYVDHKLLILAVDGLGHGPLAAEAAQRAVEIFQKNLRLSIDNIIFNIHQGLKSTRGAALILVCLDPEIKTITYAGVGNLCGKLITKDGYKGFVSHNGTVGYEPIKIKSYETSWSSSDIIILNSDGIKTNITLPNLDQITNHTCTTIAALIYKENKRGNDDATVLVLRSNQT